jgi:methylenetetrahydrofolate dehydrogenase (NADP+) / methenyltetrahydrofolate cyclohydrolase
METQLIKGKTVIEARGPRLLERIRSFQSQSGRPPGLAVVLVGEDPASQVYVRNKTQACENFGIKSFEYRLPAQTSPSKLNDLIQSLNQDPAVDGILVQFPLPKGLDSVQVLEAIDPRKDPDGLTAENMGLLWSERPRVASCTPAGVMEMIKHYQIDVNGARAVVIGRSNIVGKPMAQLLTSAHATVTLCHSRTRNLHEITRQADLVVAAAGQPRFIGQEAFREGVVVIDVGIHRIDTPDGKGKLCGDVRTEELIGFAKAITPVPGGVGPMTIQMLIENTVTLAELRLPKA